MARVDLRKPFRDPITDDDRQLARVGLVHRMLQGGVEGGALGQPHPVEHVGAAVILRAILEDLDSAALDHPGILHMAPDRYRARVVAVRGRPDTR